MTTSYTTNKRLQAPASGDLNGAWAAPVNADWNVIDAALGGHTSLSVTSQSGVVALTAPVYDASGNLTSIGTYVNPIIQVAGAFTSSSTTVNYQFPTGVGGTWYVTNSATGGGTLTFSSAGGGTTANIPAGSTVPIICDGTNVTSVSAAGSNTQVQFNNGGGLGASSFLTYTTTTSSFTASVPANSSVLTAGSVTGTITVGTVISGLTISPVTVVSFGTGTGGAGTYNINVTNGATAITGASATGVFITLTSPTFSGTLYGTAQYASYVAGTTSTPVGYLNVPQTTSTSVSSATDGEHVYTASNITITGSKFAVGDCFLVVNSGSSPLYLIPGASTTLQLAASTSAAAQNLAAGFTNGSANITGSNLPPVGTPVQFSTTGTLPTGFSTNTTYFVVSNTSNTTVTVSATQGGTAITATSAGTGSQTLISLRTVSAYGQAVVLCTGSNAFYVSGQGAS